MRHRKDLFQAVHCKAQQNANKHYHMLTVLCPVIVCVNWAHMQVGWKRAVM